MVFKNQLNIQEAKSHYNTNKQDRMRERMRTEQHEKESKLNP